MRGYRVAVELTLEGLYSPGNWLSNRDELYLSIEAFNQSQRTRLLEPVFPVMIHERLYFEKIFWEGMDPMEIIETMEDLPITIELRQVADVYLGGALLAYFDTNARELFYPYPDIDMQPVRSRELIMARTVDFPGVPPRLRFYSFTALEEIRPQASRQLPSYYDNPYQSFGRRTRSRGGGGILRDDNYIYSLEGGTGVDRPTVNTALRSRSPSPEARMRAKKHILTDLVSHKKRSSGRGASGDFAGPPFIVKKVPDNLLTRKPALHRSMLTPSCPRTKSSQTRPNRSRLHRSRSLSSPRPHSGGPPRNMHLARASTPPPVVDEIDNRHFRHSVDQVAKRGNRALTYC